MMILIKNGSLYGPKFMGPGDVLIGGGRILALGESIDPGALPGEVLVIEAEGGLVTPGFIDGHQHFTGGGGEGGFPSRAPEMQLSMNTLNGVTSAVGLLGTDALTRSVKNLYAKTRAFEEEGLSAMMLTGSYWLPSPTVTGRVSDDLVYLDKCIGVKLALADIRGPIFDAKGLAELAADVRVAALVAGKPGIITVHVGVKPERLELITEVVEDYGIRADAFVLTHINRKDDRLLEQAFKLAGRGTYLDATGMREAERTGSSAIPAADLARMADEAGLWSQVSFSSDAGGSMPHWDAERKHILGMTIADPGSLLIELARLVKGQGIGLEKALQPLTETPARIYGLEARKGRLAADADGDVLVLDRETLHPRHVVSKGLVMVRDFVPVKKGYFEAEQS